MIDMILYTHDAVLHPDGNREPSVPPSPQSGKQFGQAPSEAPPSPPPPPATFAPNRKTLQAVAGFH